MRKKTVLIVGGGTAGLTIANRLQDDFNVVVVEKSKYKTYPSIYKVPLLIGLLYRKKVLKYVMKRALTLANGRVIPLFESNVLGGASTVNGCVHTIGSKEAWERILVNFGSSYQELIENYEESYTTQREGNKIALLHAPQNVVDKAFLMALGRNSVPLGDMNFSDAENCGPIYNTAGRIYRSSVLSLISKRGFKTFLDETVEEVLFEDGVKAVGVKTDRRTIRSDYVILSGGVIGTCRLLLKSQDAPNTHRLIAGLGVRDHTNLRINIVTRNEIGSLNEISGSFQKKWSMLVKHLSGMRTLMVGTGATSGAHLDLDGDGKVDTRIQVVQFTETGRHGSDGRYFLDRPGFSLSITPIQPKSQGTIRANDGDVIVDPKFLAEDADVDLLRSALAFCLRLLRTNPLDAFVEEIVDEDIIETDPEKYIRDNIYSGHHLVGGTQHLLDANFSVNGLNGLYVCDASAFGHYPASNIHSSVVLLSQIFAKRFVSNHTHSAGAPGLYAR